MSGSTRRLFYFVFFIITFFAGNTISSFAATPGVNIINNIGNVSHIPDANATKWLVFTPDSPADVASVDSLSADTIVLRIHSNWTDIGKKMLGSATEQAEAATQWADAINAHTSKIKYIEPFNELEVDGERASPTGELSINEGVARAKNFITLLRSKTSIEIISPAMSSDANPQSKLVRTAFGDFLNTFNTISFHPYSVDEAKNYASYFPAGKKYIFTEFGVRSGNGALYNDCAYILLLCNQGIASFWQGQSDVIAYFIFSDAPGNESSSWSLTNIDVTNALQNQCSNLTTEIPTDINQCPTSLDEGAVADRLPSTKSGAQTQIDNGARSNHSPMSSGVLASLLALIFKNDNGPEHASSNTGNAVFSDPFQYQTNDDDGGPAYIPDQTTMESPGGIATEKILSLMEQTHTVDVGTKQKNQLDTSSIKQWRLEADKLGHGAMFDLRYTITKSQGEILDDFFNLESGVSPRALSEEFYGTEFVQDWMCRLMISSDHTKGDVLTKDGNLPLLDPVIGYRGDSDCTDVTENKFNKLIKNAANTEVDRSTTKSGVASPQPINASDVYCHQPFSCSNKYGAANINCDNINHIEISDCEYKAYSARLSKYILNSTKKNNANKYIINRCESLIPMTDNAAGEIDQNILDYAAKFCSNSGGSSKLATGTNFHTLSDGTRVYDSNWDSLSLTERNYIIRTQKSQFYLCYGDAPYSCYVSIGFMPQLADSAQIHENLGCGQAVPASTIEDNLKTTPFLEHGVDFSDTAVFNDDPKVPTYAETYTNKEYFDPASWIYSSPFAGLAKLVNSLKCTVTWGDKTFNIAGVDIKLRVPVNGCRTDVKTQVLAWIYISSDVQKDYKCAVNYYDHLLPAADIEKIKAKNREICGWDDCALYTHNSYNSVGDKSDSLSIDSLYSVDTENKTVNISDKDNQQHAPATIYDPIGWNLCGYTVLGDSYLTPADWPKKNTSNCKDYRDLL